MQHTRPTHIPSSSRLPGYVLATLGSLAYAATGPIIKYLLETHHVLPLALAFWRNACIGVACLIVLFALKPKLLHVGWAPFRRFALIGATSIALFHILWIYSVQLNGAAIAAVLLNLNPSFATLGSRIFFGEHITKHQIIALFIALIGCILAVRAYDPAVFQTSWVGTLVGVGSAAGLAAYLLFNQHAVKDHNPWVSLALTMLFGAVSLFVLTLLIYGIGGVMDVGSGWTPWVVLLILALLPTLLGYGLIISSMNHIPVRIASLITLLELPATALLAFFLLGEQLEMLQMVGMVLILVAAGLPVFERKQRAA
jgi:drug/metabolite transporter (DMT)-like permease